MLGLPSRLCANLKALEKEFGRLEKASPARIEKARLDARIKRMSASNFLVLARYANRVGKMLVDLQLIDTNPFSICEWTSEEEKKLQQEMGYTERVTWDDTLDTLFGTPVFQGANKDPGEPLFWIPLLGRLQGLRSEEAAQLGPDDFGTKDGIPFMKVHAQDENRVKADGSVRTVPVHPQLVELGLMELVALRRRQGEPRLFPFMKRGKHRETFTANFTKRFGYYRKTHECYRPGMDLHALRTSFHGDLANSHCSDLVRRRLMGHEPQDEGERSYTKNLKMETLLEGLRGVHVDISRIVSPFATSAHGSSAPANRPELRLVVSGA